MKAKMTADDKKWETEEDLRALKRVEEIRADKSRLNAARKMVNKEEKALKTLSGVIKSSGNKRGR